MLVSRTRALVCAFPIGSLHFGPAGVAYDVLVSFHDTSRRKGVLNGARRRNQSITRPPLLRCESRAGDPGFSGKLTLRGAKSTALFALVPRCCGSVMLVLSNGAPWDALSVSPPSVQSLTLPLKPAQMVSKLVPLSGEIAQVGRGRWDLERQPFRH